MSVQDGDGARAYLYMQSVCVQTGDVGVAFMIATTAAGAVG